MAKIRYLIEVYNKQSSGDDYGSTPDLVISDGIALDSDGSISTTADSFQFRVHNYKKNDGTYKYTDAFRIDDLVRIYITSVEDLLDSSGSAISNKNDYLIFDGTITEIGEETITEGRTVVINGLNRLEKMMNIVFPGIFQAKYGSTMVKELIGHVNDAQRQIPGTSTRVNQITWASTNASTDVEIDYARNYRTCFELIEELSRQKINGKFNAYYYLDTSNNFHWLQKSKKIDGLKIEEGIDFTRCKWKHKVWDVINAMIVDCGNDCYERGIHAMNYDIASSAEYGLKWAPGIEVETEIAKGLKGQVEDYIFKNSEIKVDTDNFPVSYPGGGLDIGFKDRGEDGHVTGSNITVSSDAEYNSAIRDEAKWRGVWWIKSVLDLTGKVRPKCDIEMRGAHWETGILDSSDEPLNQGDFVEIVPKSTSVQYQDFPFDGLRLVAISHTLDRNGWVVDINLETDVEDFAPSRYTGETYEV